MSIANEIQRLQTLKASIKAAIEEKGVTVGDGTIDTYAELIRQITGSSAKNSVEGTIIFEDTDVNGSIIIEHNLGVVPDLFLLLPDYDVDYTLNAENAVIIVTNETIQSFALNAEATSFAAVFETRSTYGTYGAWFTVNSALVTETTAKLPKRSSSYNYRAGVQYKWIAATLDGETLDSASLPSNIAEINGGTWTQATAIGTSGTLDVEHGLTDTPDMIFITSDAFDIQAGTYQLFSMFFDSSANSTGYAVYYNGAITTRVHYKYGEAQTGITNVDESKFTITTAGNRALATGVTYSWTAVRFSK